jgi:hypothetical protein
MACIQLRFGREGIYFARQASTSTKTGSLSPRTSASSVG